MNISTFRDTLIQRVQDMDTLIALIKSGEIDLPLAWAEGVKSACEQSLRELALTLEA